MAARGENRKWMRKENGAAVALALVLSFVVYGIGQHTGMLTADVVGGPAVTFNGYSDIVVAPRADGGLRIFAGKRIEEVATLSMLLMYDPERIQLSQDDIDTSLNASYAAAGVGKGMLVLTIWNDGVLTEQQKIVDILVPGSVYDLVVGDVSVSFRDGSTETLSVELPK